MINNLEKYFLDVIRHKYADFSGRASRREFWFFHIWYALISFVITFSLSLLGLALPEKGGDIIFPILGLILFVMFIGLLLPTIALSVRRLHDAGLSGWLFLVAFLFAPITIIFGLIPPTEGRNQYDAE